MNKKDFKTQSVDLLEPDPADPDKYVQGILTSGRGLTPAYIIRQVAERKRPNPTNEEYLILEKLSRLFLKEAGQGKFSTSFHISDFNIKQDDVLNYLKWLNRMHTSVDYQAMYDEKTDRIMVSWL